jgi:enamine deaminase RidA (YjgF/YER057c/UK114 family)
MQVEAKLAELGLGDPYRKPDGTLRREQSGAKFFHHKAVGQLLYLSGTVPYKDGEPYLTGLVGSDLTLEQGYEAARYAALTSLWALKDALGDLDRVDEFMHMTVFVNSAPGFSEQPRVANGATDLLVALYGDRGMPTRAAIGCHGLALNSSVEVVITLTFTGEGVNPPGKTEAASGGS